MGKTKFINFALLKIAFMFLYKALQTFGAYCLFIWKVFSTPDKWKEFFKRYIAEINKLGIDSIPLVIIISLFIGAVCTIQMKLNTTSPLMPRYPTQSPLRPQYPTQSHLIRPDRTNRPRSPPPPP